MSVRLTGFGPRCDVPGAPVRAARKVTRVRAGFPGLGTLINVVAVVIGALVGMAIGHRLPERTRAVVTDCLGLVTILVAALQTRVARRMHSADGETTDEAHAARERFIEGWLTASLLFCVGPLTILGSISDGLGRGIEQLALKSVLDGFAALAFASTFGIGVLFSALSVAVIQGALTVVGVQLGSVLPDAHIAALTATGGLMLAGIGLRLLRIRDVPVGNMLPALVVAPLLTQLVVWIR